MSSAGSPAQDASRPKLRSCVAAGANVSGVMRGALRLAALYAIASAFAAGALAGDQVVTDFNDNGGANQLRAKITAAQNDGGGKITFSGGGIVILTQGRILITSDITIDGAGAVSISGNNASSIFRVNPGATLTLQNVTLTRAFNNADDGGAVHNRGTLNVSACRFLENQTSPNFSGGAIATYGPLTITGSEFGGNKGGNGGAVYPRFGNAVTTITGCNFHDNEAINTTDSGLGGAILLWDGAPVTVSNSSFSNNKAVRAGGAIFVTANSTLTLKENTSVTGNTAVEFGGAMQNNGTITLTNVTFTSNAATKNIGHGGAIDNIGTATLANVTFHANRGWVGAGLYNRGPATVRDSTFSANVAVKGDGGAILNYDNLTLTNVTISGNSADGGGGGMMNLGNATFINCTLSGNSAGPNGAGGIEVSNDLNAPVATFTFKNTIIAKGTSGANCTRAVGGSFNLSDDNSCGFGSGRDNVTDLLLGPLASNGGPTQTHLPQTGSRAIDNGTGNGAPSTDQRGVPRPQAAAVDVGAVEVAPPTPTPSATPTPTATPPPNRFANISTRLRVETGDNVLIGGFIVTGTMQKRIIVRALGPSLPLEVGPLANPLLEFYDANAQLIASNDNWEDAPNRQEIIDSTIPPSNALESAILRNVDPGAYTAVVRDVANGEGVGLVEVYDLGNNQDSELANISTRGRVLTGDNVMIGGLIVTGSHAQKVILRAIGPSLAVEGRLQDPLLELYDGNGNLLSANDNWKDTQQAEIEATTIPPSHDLESAIVTFLPPAAYTAIVRGAEETTGVALIEAYGLQ